MPLYEYECEQCGARFEVIQRFSDPAVDACKTCGGPVHKLISAPAIHFKGTGWYITDYARKKNGSGESAESSASSSGSDTKGDTKGDTKSETKSETKGETKGETKSDAKGETKTDTSSSSGTQNSKSSSSSEAGGSANKN